LFIADFGGSGGSVIFYSNFNDEEFLPKRDIRIILQPYLTSDINVLSGKNSGRSIWNSRTDLVLITNRNLPINRVVNSGDGSKVFHIHFKIHDGSFWSGVLGDFHRSSGISVYSLNAIHPYIWPIGSVRGSLADSVLFAKQTCCDHQADKGQNGNSSSNARNPVQHPRLRHLIAHHIKLVFSILLFFGMPLLIIGFSMLGSHRTNLALFGWFLTMIGSMLVFAPLAMVVAHFILSFRNNVPQKCPLTINNYWGTVSAIRRLNMAPFLERVKQVQIISAPAEGSGIRQIERMTGVHRDTIMRLGVRVGKGCAELMDAKMRNLSCEHLQFDELWGFIGKKQKHVQPDDNPACGDVWTFCAIDADTKLVPSFKVGKRNMETANAFVSDVASRMKNRIQVSTDGLPGYVEAVERAFGMNVDYAQVIKVYESEAADAEVIRVDKRTFSGRPDMDLVTTSHVERLNGTTRLHMRRLTRLTYAFSKKLENFEAAIALNFAYYNFVKRHNTLRATPAMAAGIERDFWTVGNLVEATV